MKFFSSQADVVQVNAITVGNTSLIAMHLGVAFDIQLPIRNESAAHQSQSLNLKRITQINNSAS